jgi:hypothetical protein
MAKLHSLLRLNAAACLSFMMARANASLWPALSGWSETLVIFRRPSNCLTELQKN